MKEEKDMPKSHIIEILTSVASICVTIFVCYAFFDQRETLIQQNEQLELYRWAIGNEHRNLVPLVNPTKDATHNIRIIKPSGDTLIIGQVKIRNVHVVFGDTLSEVKFHSIYGGVSDTMQICNDKRTIIIDNREREKKTKASQLYTSRVADTVKLCTM